MSNIGNTSGTTGVISGSAIRIVFAGGNNVTLSQSINASSATITISAFNQTVESQTLGMSNIGNTSGTTGVVSGAQVRYLLAGGNNITLSQSLNGVSGTVTISAAAQTVQPVGTDSIGMSNVGNTSGTTGMATGSAVQFVFAGGNNITLSQSLNGASGTITISGGAGGAFTGGVSTQGNTLGTTGTVNNGIVFVGGNNITLSQSSAAGGATVTISAPSGGGLGVSTGGNTSGTTGTIDFQMVFVGGNNVTLSQSTNGSSATITISAGAGGVPIATAVKLISGQASTGTITRYAPEDHAHIGLAGVNASGTASTFVGSLMFSGTNLTLVTGGNSSAGSLGFSVAAQTVESQSFGMSNLGNTAGTTGIASGGQVRFVLQGSNNITLSQSINGASGTISIIGGAGGAFSGGVSTAGNTSGVTGTVGSQLVFVGSNNLTLSQSTNGASATITISGPTGGGAGMGSTGNTFGTSGTVGAELYFYGSGAISLSQSTNGGSGSLTIIGQPAQSKFAWFPNGAHTSSQQTNTAASFQYIQVPFPISFTRIDIPIYVSLASSATTNTGNIEISSGLVIYSISNNSTLNPITGSFGTTTYTWASNTANFNSLTGGRNASFAIASSLSEGIYYIGFQMSTTNNSSIGLSTTQLANSISLLLGSIQSASNIMDFGTTAGATENMIVGRGVAGSTITGTNATQNLANINNLGASAQRANFAVIFRNSP